MEVNLCNFKYSFVSIVNKNDYKKARIYLDEACFKGKEEACAKLKEMKF